MRPTTLARMFVVPTRKSAISYLVDTPLAVRTQSTSESRTAAVAVKSTIVSTTSVATVCWGARTTDTRRAVVGTTRTIWLRTCVVTASLVRCITTCPLCVVVVRRPTITCDRFAATVVWDTANTTRTHPAVRPRSTTTRPTRAAVERFWRKRTAITPSAAAMLSSTLSITRAAVDNLMINLPRCAVMAIWVIASLGRTRVAVDRQCTIPARASAAMEYYTESRQDLIPSTAVVRSSTRRPNKSAVAIVMITLSSHSTPLLAIISHSIPQPATPLITQITQQPAIPHITAQQLAILLTAHITPLHAVIVQYTVTQLILQLTRATNEETEVDDFLVCRSAIEHTWSFQCGDILQDNMTF